MPSIVNSVSLLFLVADPHRAQPSRPSMSPYSLPPLLLRQPSTCLASLHRSATSSVQHCLSSAHPKLCPSYSVSKLCSAVSLICSVLNLCQDPQTIIYSRTHRTVLQALPFTLTISLLSQITTETPTPSFFHLSCELSVASTFTVATHSHSHPNILSLLQLRLKKLHFLRLNFHIGFIVAKVCSVFPNKTKLHLNCCCVLYSHYVFSCH